LTLSSSRIHAAKAAWDRARSRRQHRLSFGTLFRYFNDDQVRFSEIAEASGLTIERIGQIYKRYFQRLFGGRSGRERYRLRKRREIQSRAQQREAEVFAQEHLRLVIEHARAALCKIESVSTRDRQHVAMIKMKSLIVNDHLCSVLRTTRIRKTAEGRHIYAQFSVARQILQRVDAVIFHCAPSRMRHRVFVVPQAVILRLFGMTGARFLSVYFPLRKSPVHHNQRPRVDLWQYEDAWRLLKSKRQARST